jgi:hypothetical protein
MDNPTTELKQVLLDFYLSFFPFPSQFELPSYRRNPSLHLDEYLQMRSTHQQHGSRQFYVTLHQSYVELYLQSLHTLRQLLLDTLWELDQWLSLLGMDTQQPHQRYPSAALIHWSRGKEKTRGRGRGRDGIDVFLPYSSLLWGTIGLCLLIGIRLLFRFHRRRQLRSNKSSTGGAVFSGLIDSEKRRYYQTSSSSGGDRGGGRGSRVAVSRREEREREALARAMEEGKTESMECEEDDDEEEEEWEGEEGGDGRPSYDLEGDELFRNAQQVVREGEEGEEDLLNKLWRTAGYGVTGESLSLFLLSL